MSEKTNPLFFSRVNNAAAIKVVEQIMAEASTCLQMEMCYVTQYGVKLLNRHKERLLRPGSFIIVSDDETNDLEGLNKLARLRPDSVKFNGGTETSGEDVPSGLMHAKIIYAEDDDRATLWVGSHNLTMRGLAGINIEAAMVYRGHPDEQIFADARAHLAMTAAKSTDGPIEIKEKLVKTTKSLIIECEAEENLLSTLRKAPTDFCLSLSHEEFDKDCIPPGDSIRDVRLIVYSPGSLTEDGPQSAPLFIRSGQVTGVTFTEHNTKTGSGAKWEDKPGFVRMSLRQKDRKRHASPLITLIGDSRIDRPLTICSFFVNSYPKRVEIHLDGPFKSGLEYDTEVHDVIIPDLSDDLQAHIPDLPPKEPEVVKVTTRSNPKAIQIVPYHGSLNNWHIRQIEAYAARRNIALRFEKIGSFYKYIRRGNLLSTDDKYFVNG
jgi:hypothetical protein